MKKIALVLFALVFSSLTYAYWDTVGVYDSSYTITNEGPVVITNTPPGTIFVGVVIGSATSNGTLKVYNSSGVASNQIANINLGSIMGYAYNIRVSSSITYTTTNNTGGVTIIFKRVR